MGGFEFSDSKKFMLRKKSGTSCSVMSATEEDHLVYLKKDFIQAKGYTSIHGEKEKNK